LGSKERLVFGLLYLLVREIKMNTNYKKLLSLRNETIAKNEDMLINVYGILIDRMVATISDENFNNLLFIFMKERAALATNYLKKKEDKLAHKEIYCINLLNSTFLNNNYKLVVEGKKISITKE
jgi:ribulose 1,5-bisphosphate carboxylase large subunit-like protein